jgi:hypothetical protein
MKKNRNTLFAVLAVLAALVLTLWQLPYARFVEDDYIHMCVLEELVHYPGMGPFSLYQFVDGEPGHLSDFVDNGPLPWFTSPGFKVKFFRPISSYVTALTHKVGGLNPTLHTLHSILWYVLLVLALAFFLPHAFPEKIPYVSLLVFVFMASHWSTVMYSAVRWFLVTAVFGMLAFSAHIKNKNRPSRRWHAFFFFILALCSGEAALSVLAFIVTYEIFAAEGSLRQRLAALMPYAVLTAIYLGFYLFMGYGTGGQSLYLNPFSVPWEFLSNLPGRILAMLLMCFGGTVSLILFCLLFYPAWRAETKEGKARMLWLLTGTLGSMLPLAARAPSGHSLIVPSIGIAVLLGLALHHWARVFGSAAGIRHRLKKPATPLITTIVGALLCLPLLYTFLVRAPYQWFSYSAGYHRSGLAEARFHKDVFPADVTPGQKAVFLETGGGIDLFHGYYYRKLHRLPMPASWWMLSVSPYEHRYRRIDNQRMELEMLGGGFLESPMEKAVRGNSLPLNQGDTVNLPGLDIRVLEKRGIGIVKLEFKFTHGLDSGQYRFFTAKQGFRETHLSNVP